MQELTSEAASSGESALQDHKHFAEQLWDQTAAILERVALGLESTEQLTNFVKGRKKAEEETAKQLRMMCIVSVEGGALVPHHAHGPPAARVTPRWCTVAQTTGELTVGGKLGSTALNRLGANRLLGASA